MSLANNSEVLIVGAGPTGLTLALCLQSYGIKCDICDIKIGPTTDSKALAINLLSQYQFEIFSQKNVVGLNAKHIDRLNVVWNGNNRLNPVDFRWLNYDKKFLLTQPQHITEQELIKEFSSKKGIINWKTQITKITQKDNFVEVESSKINDNKTKKCHYNVTVQ
jgi:2-polyprenyl-6-methoxyphenol hydroxylase-like FAD-dependent oxidoreductase